jgi:hypothetical protein
MEAPSYGSGTYTLAQIDYVVRTAYTGFRAAKMESAEANTVIHTGFWGCGAYGGNRVLMALLQCLAARLAEVHRLVFHTFDPAGTEAFGIALRLLEMDMCPEGAVVAVPAVLDKIHALGLRWGTSDGN